jgi:FecR protein
MKNKFALIIAMLILSATVMAGAQVSEDIPGLDQGPAQPQGQGQPQGQEQAQGEPASSVARISMIHGDVSVQRGDSGDWSSAAVNQPMVNSDKVSTGVNSRAEVQLDSGNVLRLSDSTLAGIAGLSPKQIQIQVDRGVVDYTVFKNSEAAVEIDTANAAVRPAQRDGVYRIEIDAVGETQVIVRKGSAEIATPQGSTQVEAGQMAVVRGTGDDTQYKLVEAPSKDSWDTWNSERDRLIYDAQSWKNTNRNYTGSEDLDSYGRWVTVPNYGPVWSPVVTPGWAPYRSGRWVWEPGWGWTWVSYEPWGWAPYHYGRWFVYNSSWVWWPGPAYGYPGYRPVWAPAYVSFFGFGGGVGLSVGFGFGSVGWLPVGPCDAFYPWYGRYGSHYSVVNVTNIYNVHAATGRGFAPLRSGNAYSNLRMAAINDRVRGGISTVPTGQFGTGRSTPVGVNGETFRGGRMMTGNLPVVPTRAALSVNNRPAAASTIPRGGQQQRFFSQTRPAAAPPSFDRQVSQMQRSIQGNSAGQSLSRDAGLRTAGSTTVPRPTPGVRTPGGLNNSAAAQQSERGASLNSDRTARPATSEGSEGWRRFSGSSGAQNGAMTHSTGPAAGSSAVGSNNAGYHNNVPRPGNSSRPEASSNDGGWRHFTPQSGGGSADRMNADRMNGDRMNGGPGMNGGRNSGPEYQRGEMSPNTGGRSMVQDGPRGYSRPPLEMRQPIVTQRTSEGRGSAPQMTPASRGSSGGGGGGNHGGSGGGGGSHGGGGSPHGGSGRR